MDTCIRRPIVRGDSVQSPKLFFSLWVLFLIFSGVTELQAAAPLRPGQPYAEAEKCASAEVIFCEDFNYPQNFSYSSSYGNSYSTWTNPGLVGGGTTLQTWNSGRQVNSASSYPAKPQGAMASGSQSDYVWVANWDPNKGVQGDGSTWGILRDSGANYVNGMSPATDFYARFQVYFTANYAWPGDPKVDKYNFGAPWPVIDNKIIAFQNVESLPNPTGTGFCAIVMTGTGAADPATGGRFADAIIVRYGDASDNDKWFPLCSICTENPQHNEYAYQSTILRDPHDTPTFGKMFRFDTNHWYTIEMHVKESSSPGAKNGVIEIWVDGTKVYSANDLATCGTGLGDCSGVGAFYISAYHNSLDTTQWNGQEVIDNLIISKAYIGPPSGGSGSGDTTSPAAPKNLRKR
jgi:hypothetical protein